MKTTIDRAGRLVVPRGLRAQVGLVEGGDVEIAVQGGAIVIEPVHGLDLQREGPFMVIPATGRAIDDGTVHELRLGDQR